ncbi:unnamed protein product [Parajaminaea phylloscopi]
MQQGHPSDHIAGTSSQVPLVPLASSSSSSASPRSSSASQTWRPHERPHEPPYSSSPPPPPPHTAPRPLAQASPSPATPGTVKTTPSARALPYAPANDLKVGWGPTQVRREMSASSVPLGSGGSAGAGAGDHRSFSGAISSHRTHLPASTKYFLTVIPPEDFPIEPPHPRNASATGSYEHMRRGTLLPLYPTLNGQLYAIAREHGLPSIGGLSIYLCEDGDGNLGPRIGDAAWQALWSSFFNEDLEQQHGLAVPSNALGLTPPMTNGPASPAVHRAFGEHQRATSGRQSPVHRTPSSFAHRLAETSNSSWRVGSPLPTASEAGSVPGNTTANGSLRPASRLASALPIVGRVEWTVERRRAAWWSTWVGEAADATTTTTSAATSLRSADPSRPQRTRSLKLSKGLAPASARTPLRNISAPLAPPTATRPESTTTEGDADGGNDGGVAPSVGPTHRQSGSSATSLARRDAPRPPSGYAPLPDGSETEEIDDIAARTAAEIPKRRSRHRSQKSSAAASSRHISKASRDLHRLTFDDSTDDFLEQEAAIKRRTLESVQDGDESVWRALRGAPRPPSGLPNGFHAMAQRNFAPEEDYVPGPSHSFEMVLPSDARDDPSSPPDVAVKDWIQRTQQSPDLLRDRAALVPEDISYGSEGDFEGDGDGDGESLGVPPQDDVKEVTDLWLQRGSEQLPPIPSLVHSDSNTTLPISAPYPSTSTAAAAATTSAPAPAKLLSPIALDDSGVFQGTAPQLGSLMANASAPAYARIQSESSEDEDEDDLARHSQGASLKPPRSPGETSIRSNSASTDASGLEDFERALELLSPVTSSHPISPTLAQLGITASGGKMTSRDSLNAARTLSTSVAPSPRWLARNRQSAHAGGPPTPKQTPGVRPASASAISASPSSTAPDHTPRARPSGNGHGGFSALLDNGTSGGAGLSSLLSSSPAVPPLRSPLRESFGHAASPGRVSSIGGDSPIEPRSPAGNASVDGDRNGSTHGSSARELITPDQDRAPESQYEYEEEPVQAYVQERSRTPEPAGNPTSSHPTSSHPTSSHPTSSHPTSSHPTAGHPTAGQISVSSSALTLASDTTSRDGSDVSGGSVIIYESPKAQSTVGEPHEASEPRETISPRSEGSASSTDRQSTYDEHGAGIDNGAGEGAEVLATSDPNETMQAYSPAPQDSGYAPLGEQGAHDTHERHDMHDHRDTHPDTHHDAHEEVDEHEAGFWRHAVHAPTEAADDSVRETSAMESGALSPPLADHEDARPSITRLIRGQSFSASSVAPSSLAVTPDRGEFTPRDPARESVSSFPEPDHVRDSLPAHSIMEALATADPEPEPERDDDVESLPSPLSPALDLVGESLPSRREDEAASEIWSQDGSSRYSRYYYDEQARDPHSTSNSGLSRREDSGPETPSFYFDHQLAGSQLDNSKHLSGASSPRWNADADVREADNIGLGLSESGSAQWPSKHEEHASLTVHPLSSPAAAARDAEGHPTPTPKDDVTDDLDAMLSSMDAFNNHGSSRSWSRPSSGALGSEARSFSGGVPGSARSIASSLPMGHREQAADDDDEGEEHTLAAMQLSTQQAVRQALTNSERFAHEPALARSSLTSTKSMTNISGQGGRRSLSPRRASIGLGRSASGDSFRPSTLSPKSARFRTLPPSPNFFPVPEYATDVQQPMSPLSPLSMSFTPGPRA